jgi:uncharacterized protein with FMN-binding domain
MSSQQSPPTSGITRAIRRYLLSAFVMVTFAAYALHVRLADTAAVAEAPTSGQSPIVTPLVPPLPTATPPAPVAELPTAAPLAQPTDAPSPVPTPLPARGQLRDGRYTGPTVDAYWGNVQVQAMVQDGRIADVQILEYPSDRRTSIRINNQAIPYLTEEALQAQSAHIDIITGATLTSEAYIESLQSALTSAGA